MNKFNDGDKVRLIERSSIYNFFDPDEVFTVVGFGLEGRIVYLKSNSGPRAEVSHIEIVPA